jgi:type I restriction enzyme M protein
MNRLLREANIKDEYRPAYIGAMMLALWESHGSISRTSSRVLYEVNSNCEAAFSRGGKSELAKSLRVDVANSKLAKTAWMILATLEKLNVVAGSVDHDYLGQLYELFFRYTGGNTIGQYFTPRHITRLMADICETSKTDLVIDPACGTGGFLIACIQRAYHTLGIKYEDAVKIVRDKLIGYESEPVTAALCVANMILRGDGKTGVRKNDCFTASDYPIGNCQVALMNPPFPHKQTDVPPQQFVERALEALENRGLLSKVSRFSV